jgi:superfamily II DNA or RNA helicase
LLKDIKLLVIDEVHKLKYANKINKVVEQIPALFRYGFTGTLPDYKIDQWNIFGKIGRVIYFKESIDLRDQNYISQVHVAALKLTYKNTPQFTTPSMHNPTAGYEEEITWLQTNPYRNAIIIKLVNKSDKNTLIMVDRIAHGEELLKILQESTNKQVHFVHGAVEIEEREMIRKLMEEHDNVACIAISKIFSTGINIKNLHNIIFAAIGKARIKIIQSIGRSLRKHSSKKLATIFDIWDNLRYGNKHMVERLALYDREQIPYCYGINRELIYCQFIIDLLIMPFPRKRKIKDEEFVNDPNEEDFTSLWDSEPKKKKKRVRRTKEELKPNYVDPIEMENFIIQYYEQGGKDIPSELADMIQKIATRLGYAQNFINYSYKEEMIGDAIIKMITAVTRQRFKCKSGYNPFSYFTKVAYRAFQNRIKKEKKEHDTIHRYQTEVYTLLTESGQIPSQKNTKFDTDYDDSYRQENA